MFDLTQWHLDSKKKPSGAKNAALRRTDKRLAQKGGDFSATKIAVEGKPEKRKTAKVLGGNVKVKAHSVKFISVTNPKTKKTFKAEIVSVIENPANRQYARQNIITKNALVKIKIEGKEEKARVTSRPGQSGTVQGILLE